MPGFSGVPGGGMDDEEALRQLVMDLRQEQQPVHIPLERQVTPPEELAYYEGEPSVDPITGNPINPQVYAYKKGIAHGGIPKHLRNQGKPWPAWAQRGQAPAPPMPRQTVGLD